MSVNLRVAHKVVNVRSPSRYQPYRSHRVLTLPENYLQMFVSSKKWPIEVESTRWKELSVNLRVAHKVLNVRSPSQYQPYRSHRVLTLPENFLQMFVSSKKFTNWGWVYSLIGTESNLEGGAQGTKCAFPLSISTIQITQSPNFTRKLPTDVCEFKKIDQLRLSLPTDRNLE